MNKPIHTAVLSYGMSGRVFHCPLMSALDGYSIDVIVKRNGDSVPRYPKAKIVKSVEEAIRMPEIELVVVNVPNEFHFQFASQALQAGKHVIVEKPFVVTTEEAV